MKNKKEEGKKKKKKKKEINANTLLLFALPVTSIADCLVSNKYIKNLSETVYNI
jgi:hypothetical protein